MAFFLIKKAIRSDASTKLALLFFFLAVNEIFRITWSHYGQLIAVAWIFFRKEDEEMCHMIEEEMMKGLFDSAIMVQSPLSDRFMEVEALSFGPNYPF